MSVDNGISPEPVNPEGQRQTRLFLLGIVSTLLLSWILVLIEVKVFGHVGIQIHDIALTIVAIPLMLNRKWRGLGAGILAVQSVMLFTSLLNTLK